MHWLTAAVKKGGPSRERAIVVIRRTVEETHGRMQAGADRVGMSRASFYRLVQGVDLDVHARSLLAAWKRRARDEKKTPCKVRNFLIIREAA
jgi:hypothetical protein